MRKLRLLLVACIITITATAQEIITYTHTKTVLSSGEELEGGYDQLQVMFVGNQLRLPQFNNLTHLYDHQENGWSVYYLASWNNWSRQWILHKTNWYSVSPDRKTLNCPGATIGGFSSVLVYKQGVQHKNIGPMYE